MTALLTSWTDPEVLVPEGLTTKRERPRAGPAMLLLVAVALGLAWLGRYAMFTSTESFDDDGDWLIGLRMFQEHGSLYHATWSQCGPFYYDFWSVVFTASRSPIDVDSGRVAALVTWICIAFLGALLVWSSTHRLSLAVLVQVAIFLVMEPLSGEPMEPAGLATLLVAGALLCGSRLRPRRPRLAMFLVGALGSAAVLTKVNVGAFLVGGVLLGMLLAWQPGRGRWARHLLAAGIVVGIPVLLCSAIISRSWVTTYVELVALSGLTVVVASLGSLPLSKHGGGPSAATAEECSWFVAGGAFLATIVIFVSLATGTDLRELVQGAFLAPRSLPEIVVGPLQPEPRVVLVALLSMGVAIATLLPLRRRIGPAARIAGRVAVGVLIVVTCVGGVVVSNRGFTWTHAQTISALFQTKLRVPGPMAVGSFQYGVPFAWVAIRKPGPDGVSHLSAERCMIASVAVLLTLEGFPVAGHQTSWSVVALLVVGVLVLGDALSLVTRLPGRRLQPLTVRATILATLTLLISCNLLEFGTNYGGLYADNVKPQLTGAGLVRWPGEVVTSYQSLTTVLSSHCTTFYGLPGLNSFYFFTGERPPTGLLTTQWMYLMDVPTQQRVVQALRRVPRLCVLYYQPALSIWQDNKPLPLDSPILQYMEDGFAPIDHVGDYIVLARSRKGRPPSSTAEQLVPRFRLPVGPVSDASPPDYS
jgi:hypothetical protein